MFFKFFIIVLLNEEKDLVVFGYEVEEMYLGDEYLDYFYFYRFKMMFYD